MARLLTRAGSALRLCVLAGLVLVVTAGHVGVADLLESRRLELLDTSDRPRRLSVVYVREMSLVAPSTPSRPAPPPRPASPRPPPVVPAVAAAQADTPSPDATPPPPEPAAPATEREPAPPVASRAEEFDESSPPPEFDWPESTRLHYKLTGYVRGEVHGQAQVEWIREGQRYQVHLDVEIGPSLAPLATRRMSSDGIVTPDGLRPQYYDQATRMGFALPHRAEVRFFDEQVLLATGQSLPRLPGVQDTVSQFVQISWLFDAQPQRLRVGEVVEMPLALPRKMSVWVYDVVGEELLYTPFGDVPTYHLKPRTAPGTTGDLVTELWIAPGLRHLPVRFRIHQDAENYVDLMLDQRPQLAVKM